MAVTVKEVKYIAKLSKLKFSEKEAEDFAKEFGHILDKFKTLEKLQLDDVEEIRSNISIVREDKAVKCEIKDLFSNSKTMRDTYIEVPKIIE